MVDKSLYRKQKIVQHESPPIKTGMNGCTRKVKTSSCVLCKVVSNTYCAWFLYFVCLRLVSWLSYVASFFGLSISDCPFDIV